jgi:hypothetical protein
VLRSVNTNPTFPGSLQWLLNICLTVYQCMRKMNLNLFYDFSNLVYFWIEIERCFFTGMKINNATIRKYYTTILSKDCMSLILQAKYFHVACTSWDTLKWNIQALCNTFRSCRNLSVIVIRVSFAYVIGISVTYVRRHPTGDNWPAVYHHHHPPKNRFDSMFLMQLLLKIWWNSTNQGR